MDFEQLPLWKRLHWTNTLFLTLTPIATLILVPYYFYTSPLSGWLLAFCFVFTIATSFSITGGYHRLFAHRAYDAVLPVRLFYLLFGAAAVQGSVRKWASDHRRHHRRVDTKDDPYSIKEGFWYAHIGWVFLKENPKYYTTWPMDLDKDPLVKWQDRHITLLTIGMGFVFPTVVGWMLGSALGGFALGGLFRVVFTQHCTFFINSLCHYVGAQTYSDEVSARDSWFMAFLSYGEGYHSFHHRFQADYRNGIRWYHWDPSKWAIRAMAYLGWTKRLRETPAELILKARLQIDEKRLIQEGIPPEKVTYFSTRILQAQERWRQLQRDYTELKRSVQNRAQLLQAKAELKVARLEYKLARAQWGMQKRYAAARNVSGSFPR